MAGTFIMNLLFSLIGFLLYFSLSYSKYYPIETFIHSSVVGIVFWVSGYLVRYLFGKSFQAYSEHSNETSLVGQSYSSDGATTKENDQPLSENDIEQVSKYIKDLMNNE